MLRVAQELQGAETSFVDLSYNLSAERTIPEGESEEDKKAQDQADDAEIVERLEKAIRPDTKVRWGCMMARQSSSALTIGAHSSSGSRHPPTPCSRSSPSPLLPE